MEATISDYREWLERSYPLLTESGLWLRGGELNTLPAPELAHRPFRVLLARLSTYHDAGASFTHQLLYQVAADTPGVFPDLAYLPPRQDLPLLRRDRVPWLLGTQTKRGPSGFDLVGFSLSIVQELLNLPRFLQESGIPLGKQARLARADLPLLLLGGSSALYAAALWGADPLVDAIFVGEDLAAIRQILELGRENQRRGLGKRELLDALDGVPGLIEPDRPRPTRKAHLDLDAGEGLQRGPVLWHADQLGSGRLQISEGCPCFCSFCAECWDRKPYRERSAPALFAAALGLKAAMGLEAIELYSASFNAHSGLSRLLWELAPAFHRVGLKSQRFDILAHDPELVAIQRLFGKSTLTCGLEGISPRLRRYLHKNLSEHEIEASIDAVLRSRARELKISLIATGLEEEEDLLALRGLLGQLRATRERHRAPTRIIFSLTPLVRFPWTPLEWEDAPPLERLEPILREVERLVTAASCEFRTAADLAEYWVSQVLVRAADERVTRALQRSLEQTGFIYYRGVSREFQHRFREELRAEGIAPDELLRGRPAAEDPPPPWRWIETGVSLEFLRDQAQGARACREIEYCLGRPWAHARCAHCGACTPAEASAMVGARPDRPFTLDQLRQRLRREQQAERPLRFHLRVGPAARGVPRRALGVALARALMLADPALVPCFRRIGTAHFELGGAPVWLTGEECLTLFWNERALATIEAMAADPAGRARVQAILGEWGEWLALAPESWRPGSILITSPFAFDPDRQLRTLGLRYTRRRVSEGAYRLEFTRDARRRGILLDLAWQNLPDGGAQVQLAPGPKLDPHALIKQCFRLPHPAEWVRIRAEVTS